MKAKFAFLLALLVLCAGCAAQPQITKVLESDRAALTQPSALDAEIAGLLYQKTLSFLSPEEQAAAADGQAGLVLLCLPSGAALTYCEGCTAQTEAPLTLLALDLGERYRLIAPFHSGLEVKIPSCVQRPDTPEGQPVSSPNVIFTAREQTILPIAEWESSQYLQISELSLAKGASCALDVLYHKGWANLMGGGFTASPAEASALPVSQSRMACVREDFFAGFGTIAKGTFLYDLGPAPGGEESLALVGGGDVPVCPVPRSNLVFFSTSEELFRQLPPDEYVIMTSGDYCFTHPDAFFGLHRAEELTEFFSESELRALPGYRDTRPDAGTATN